MKVKNKMNKKTKVLLAIICVVFFCSCLGLLVFFMGIGSIRDNTANSDRVYVRDDVYQDLIPVCKGEGVPEAKPFDPDAEIHPTIVMTDSGKYWSSRSGLGEGWTATSVSETEIVICIGEETTAVAYCAPSYYQNGMAARRVRIRFAETGELYIFKDLLEKYTCNGKTYRELSLPAIKELLIFHIPSMEDFYRSRHPW